MDSETAATPQWSAAFDRLAAEQQADVHLTPNRDQLYLRMSPGTGREELLRRLKQTLDLINLASQIEQDQLGAASPLEEAARDWWRGG